MKLSFPVFSLLSVAFFACATIENDLPPDAGAGGAGSGGSPGGNTGGTIGAGNSSSGTGGRASGGASAGTGGTSTGGSGAGGTATGGAGTGGAATGGSSSGGAGSGGAPMIVEGDCAGLPTLATWPAPRATGDQVVLQCTIAQASCAGLPTNTNILWECIATHVPNCEGQSPSGGTGVWEYVRTCTAE